MPSYLDNLKAVAQGSQEILNRLTTRSIKLERREDLDSVPFSGRWGETVAFSNLNYSEDIRATVRQAFLAIGARQVELLKAEIRRCVDVAPDTPLPSIVSDLLDQVPEKFVENTTRLMWGDWAENLPTEDEWRADHPDLEAEFSFDGVHASGIMVLLYKGTNPGSITGLDVIINAFQWKKDEDDLLRIDTVLNEEMLRI